MNYPDYGPYHDYPNEPIGGSNPYWRCCACGISDPQINGTLSGHASDCSWVESKRAKLETPAVSDSERFVWLASHITDYIHDLGIGERGTLSWIDDAGFSRETTKTLETNSSDEELFRAVVDAAMSENQK